MSRAYLNIRLFSSFLRRWSSAVPKSPILPVGKQDQVPVKIDNKTIEHLERLSLVDFANREGIRRLEEAIQFANQIHSVDTTNVEPLVTVLQGEYTLVRDDVVTEGDIRDDIMSNAAVKEEEYFFAPPGNIPLPEKDFTYNN